MQKLAMSLQPLIDSSNGLQTSIDRRQTMGSYAAERSRLLFGQYRRGDANDPDTYVASVAAVLSGYSSETIKYVTDPRTGIGTREKFIAFMPNPGEVRAMCEEIEGPKRRAREWNERAERQLAERAELETGPRQVPQHCIDELAERGLLKDKKLKDLETPGKVMARLGLTQEQWDAMPNAKRS